MLDDLIALIESNEELMAILGDNLYVIAVEFESGLPAMMVETVGNNPTVSKDSDMMMDRYSVDFNLYAEQYSQIQTMLDLIRLQMNCYSSTHSNTGIREIRYADESDLYEENNNLKLKTVSYSVIY